MPSLKTFIPLALAGGVLANPYKRDDACLAAVTGSAALGDANLRKGHCSSYLSTIVTPSAITVTTTITGAPAATSSAGGWDKWKKDVTVCPNEVPNYASACDDSHYASACSVWGITATTTITIPATTSTATVWAPTGGYSGGSGPNCGPGVQTVTVTVTSTSSPSGPTSGHGGNGPSGPGPNCISADKAQYFADGFKTLLEYTSYNGTQGKPGRGYQQNVSDAILATTFQDYSDSINWMAGIPLGSVTFASKAAFDYGQGVLQPELSVQTLNVFPACTGLAWRWRATTQTNATVTGVNYMDLTADLSKIQTNYAEFDNAAWLETFGLKCSLKA